MAEKKPRTKISRNQAIGIILVLFVGIFFTVVIIYTMPSNSSNIPSGCHNPKPTSSTAMMVGNTKDDTYYSANVFQQSFIVPSGKDTITAIYIKTKPVTIVTPPSIVFIEIRNSGDAGSISTGGDVGTGVSPIYFSYTTSYTDFVKNCWFNITTTQFPFTKYTSGMKYTLLVVGNVQTSSTYISVGASKTENYLDGRLSFLGAYGIINVENNMGLPSNYWQFPLNGISDMAFQICFA